MTALTDVNLIITANLRQAIHLRESLPSHIDIMPLSQFLTKTVQADPYLRLLSDYEDKELWNSVIENWQRDTDKTLVNGQAAARLAKQAYELMLNYRIGTADARDNGTAETAVMAQWIAQYQARLTQSNAQTTVQFLNDALDFVQIPANSAFFGFYLPTAAEVALLTREHANGVFHFLHSDIAPVITCRAFSAIEDEVAACAKWVKAHVDANNNARIAVVVPDILKHKALIQKVFDHTLVPDSIFRPLSNFERPYRMSIGSPLLSYPVIALFFDVFKLRLSSKFLFDDISLFLRNPLVGGAKQEYRQRAKLEVQLRQLDMKKISWATLKRVAGTANEDGLATDYFCPDLLARMDAYEQLMQSYGKGRFDYDVLAQLFQEVATIWGLRDHLASRDHDEILMAFLGDEKAKGVLPAFASLSQTLAAERLMNAITKLRKITSETLFQPSSGKLNVQIMSESDALGIHFDALWMLDLSAKSWPAKTQPNPFIAQYMQVKYGIPHASADQELAYANFVTQQLMSNTNEAVLSCHLSEQGEEVKPSSILLDKGTLGAVETCPLPSMQIAKVLSQQALRETVIDSQAPALDMSKPVFGGTHLFKAQAQCPFKGFVENRLAIKELRAPEVGLSARLRGDVLHLVLEMFWRTVKNQQTLRSLHEQGLLETEVAKAVTATLSRFALRKPDTFTSRIVEVEFKRLHALVCQWMREVELERAPFEKVEVESSRNIVVKGMQLTVKMDHSDAATDTGFLNIADNKTGQVTPEDWFASRLIEPQLPLYALIEAQAGNSINSVTYKRLKKGDLAVKGIGVNNDAYPKFRSVRDMEGVLDTWRVKIDGLAEEYQSGVANISPASLTKSCTYCPLKSACRYHLN